MTEPRRGAVVVCHADKGEGFWQPVPANGYAEVHVSKRDSPAIARFSSGIQVIAPGGRVREHQHADREELVFFFEGTGRAVVNGEEHAIRPGTSVYVGPWNRHTFINDGEADLKALWVILPGGLEDIFQAIGRRRDPGEPAPDPFPRPDDAAGIEAGPFFAALDRTAPGGRD